MNVLVAELPRKRGFDAITARAAGQLSKSDAEQLAYAVSQGTTLLTHNRVDFEALAREYFSSGQMHYGMILAVRRPPHEIVQRLLTILDRLTADEMENQLCYI